MHLCVQNLVSAIMSDGEGWVWAGTLCYASISPTQTRSNETNAYMALDNLMRQISPALC